MMQYDIYEPIPDIVVRLIANKVRLLDQYILFQTGPNEYGALVRDTATDSLVHYRVYWNEFNGAWYVEESPGTAWEWNVGNEVYCYSNVGYGAALELPVVPGAIAYASVFICATLMFAIAFKGILFPVLRVRRRSL